MVAAPSCHEKKRGQHLTDSCCIDTGPPEKAGIIATVMHSLKNKFYNTMGLGSTLPEHDLVALASPNSCGPSNGNVLIKMLLQPMAGTAPPY